MGTGGVWVWGRGPIKIPLPLTAAGGEGRRVSVNLLGLCPPLLSRGCSATLKGVRPVAWGPSVDSGPPSTAPWGAVDIREFRCGQWKRVWWG